MATGDDDAGEDAGEDDLGGSESEYGTPEGRGSTSLESHPSPTKKTGKTSVASPGKITNTITTTTTTIDDDDDDGGGFVACLRPSFGRRYPLCQHE